MADLELIAIALGLFIINIESDKLYLILVLGIKFIRSFFVLFARRTPRSREVNHIFFNLHVRRLLWLLLLLDGWLLLLRLCHDLLLHIACHLLEIVGRLSNSWAVFFFFL